MLFCFSFPPQLLILNMLIFNSQIIDILQSVECKALPQSESPAFLKINTVTGLMMLLQIFSYIYSDMGTNCSRHVQHAFHLVIHLGHHSIDILTVPNSLIAC